MDLINESNPPYKKCVVCDRKSSYSPLNPSPGVAPSSQAHSCMSVSGGWSVLQKIIS